MKLTDYFILLLVQLLLFLENAEMQSPTITTAPNATVLVVEGERVTLEWTYDLHGIAFRKVFFTTQGVLFIVEKSNSDPVPLINGNYGDRITANVTETYSSITFLSVNKTKDSKIYEFSVQNLNGAFDLRQVEMIVQIPASITGISRNQTKKESDSVNLICNSTGDPAPSITWRRLSDNTVVNSSFTITGKQDEGAYRCTADNGVGNAATADVYIAVQIPPSITGISGNQTKNESDSVNLICNATGDPAPSITWTRLSDNSVVNSSFTITGKQDEGAYRCTADNGIGNTATADVYITVQNHHPRNTNLTTNLTDNTVVVDTSFNLICSAQANPPAKYRFYKEQESLFNTTAGSDGAVNTTSVSERIPQVNYSCIPFNFYGYGPTKTVIVTVHYPPLITKPQNRIHSINASENDTIECLAEANPAAQYVWKKATGEVASNDGYLRLNNVNDSDGGNYTCTATNRLDSDNFTILVKVTRREISLELTVVFLNGEEVVYRPEYDDLNSAVAKEFVGRFETEVKKKCTTNSTECQVKVTKLRKGSVIVSFTLIFTTPVTTNEGLAELIDAVNNGTIGPYSVRALKVIQQVEPTTTPSSSPTGTTTTEKKTTPSSDGPPWVIIGAVIGGVVVFAIIVAVVAWCVHKKRECRRKDAKIHHSESEEQEAFSRQEGQLGAEDNAYSQVNHGFAGTGPRSNGTETVPLQQRAAADGSDAAAHQQEAAASPTYGEVDKSKKKKKKEEEEKLDYTYPEVDRSKETKKKPKSGEMVYADLEDINVPRAMPTVSTSPQPLPSIKRPEPYENTQYADVTQFLKGDATLPQSDSNQGTELQPQGANKDEDGAGGEDRNKAM